MELGKNYASMNEDYYADGKVDAKREIAARQSLENICDITGKKSYEKVVDIEYGHINFYTSEIFRNLLNTSGLKVDAFRIFHHDREYEVSLRWTKGSNQVSATEACPSLRAKARGTSCTWRGPIVRRRAAEDIFRAARQ